MTAKVRKRTNVGDTRKGKSFCFKTFKFIFFWASQIMLYSGVMSECGDTVQMWKHRPLRLGVSYFEIVWRMFFYSEKHFSCVSLSHKRVLKWAQTNTMLETNVYVCVNASAFIEQANHKSITVSLDLNSHNSSKTSHFNMCIKGSYMIDGFYIKSLLTSVLFISIKFEIQ